MAALEGPGGCIYLWDVENCRVPAGMNIAAAVQLIRRIAGCDQACGGLGHEDCGFHIAYTHDVLDKFQLNSLKGLGGVNTHSVLGKVAGKGHEAEDKLGEVLDTIMRISRDTPKAVTQAVVVSGDQDINGPILSRLYYEPSVRRIHMIFPETGIAPSWLQGLALNKKAKCIRYFKGMANQAGMQLRFEYDKIPNPKQVFANPGEAAIFIPGQKLLLEGTWEEPLGNRGTGGGAPHPRPRPSSPLAASRRNSAAEADCSSRARGAQAPAPPPPPQSPPPLPADQRAVAAATGIAAAPGPSAGAQDPRRGPTPSTALGYPQVKVSGSVNGAWSTYPDSWTCANTPQKLAPLFSQCADAPAAWLEKLLQNIRVVPHKDNPNRPFLVLLTFDSHREAQAALGLHGKVVEGCELYVKQNRRPPGGPGDGNDGGNDGRGRRDLFGRRITAHTENVQPGIHTTLVQPGDLQRLADAEDDSTHKNPNGAIAEAEGEPPAGKNAGPESSLASLKHDLEVKLQEIDQLHKQLSASLAGKAAAMQQVSQMKEKNDDLNETCCSLRGEIALHVSAKEALAQKLTTVEQQCSLFAAKERLDRARRRFGPLNRPVSIVNRGLRREKSEAQEAVNELQQAVARQR